MGTMLRELLIVTSILVFNTTGKSKQQSAVFVLGLIKKKNSLSTCGTSLSPLQSASVEAVVLGSIVSYEMY